MFTRFDEADRRRERRRWVGAVSVGAHAIAVWLAAAATKPADAKTPVDEKRPSDLIFVEPLERTQPERPSEERRAQTGAPRAPEQPTPPGPLPPIDIDEVAPPVTFGEPRPTPEEILGGARESASGEPGGGTIGEVGRGSGPGGAWTGAMVDVEVAPRPGNPAPRYPAQLEQLGVAGQVIVRFVVDTAGRVESGSITIVASDHDAFADAVRRVLPDYRFEPARLRGARVRQLVEMPFVFEVQR